MAIFKSYITPNMTTVDLVAYFDANPEMAPTSANPKKLMIKAVDLEDGSVHTTEVWDCTEEEHESNGWGVIPSDLVDAIGVYATPNHLEIDESEYEPEDEDEADEE